MSTAAATAFDATNVAWSSEALNRTKGFLGTSEEMTSVAETLAPHSVEWVRSLSDNELLPLGEKALHDIADDILVLDEIRQRFRKTPNILGYNGWRDFVEKNSCYSIRTIQRRLSEKNGKEESKTNIVTGNMYTRPKPTPTVEVPAETLAALTAVNPDVAQRVRAGTLAPRPHKMRRTTPAQLQSKDFYHSVGHRLANVFSGVDARLNEIAHMRKSDWNPVAEEGVSRLIKNLEQVSKEATAYAAKLKDVLRKNR
jgi:hypothetical protein